MCRVLNVSVSGYHSWRRRPPSTRTQEDVLLQQRIQGIHVRTKGRYGAPRIHADLRSEGVRVSRKRVTRLMRASGLRGKGKRRWVRTTDSDHAFAVSPNLLERQFNVPDPNQVWASDITYLPTREGWLYLAVTLDLHSRAVVGYAMEAHTHASLPLAALQMAASRRDPPPGLLHHSDRGSQFASRVFQEELARLRARGSMSRKGDCWDNAVVESFFSSLKRELFEDAVFESRAVARQVVFELTTSQNS